MFTSLSARITETSERCEEIAGVLPELRETVPNAPEGEVARSLDNLERKIEALRSCIGQFKVELPDREGAAPKQRERRQSPATELASS